MTVPQLAPLIIRYKPWRWVTVLLANTLLLAVSVAIAVIALMSLGEQGWKAIVLAVVGGLMAWLGLGNALGARKTFAPTDMVAAGVDVDGFILPTYGLVPWSAFAEIDFSYDRSAGPKMIFHVACGMDDRKVLVRLDPEELPPDLRADIEKHSPEAFGGEGMELALVTGLVGGTNSYVKLLRATETAMPRGFPLSVTSKDRSFLRRLDAARTAA